jgi:hypothetical protein
MTSNSPASITDQIRSACQTVAERARFVHIMKERIPAYAAQLPLERIMRPEHDAATHYLGHGDDTVAFFLTLDAINFGSGYFPYLRKRPGMSGYFTIAAGLNEHFETQGPIAPAELARITPEQCAAIFGQDLASAPVAELMAHFASALRDLGQYLLDRFDGRFTSLDAAAGGSAERLVELLAQMPYFADVATYEGVAVPFYKRAQIAASDLWIAFDGQGPGFFQDMDRLTIFADNLVPHVLRVDGLLGYEETLAARIDAEQPIAAGAPEEVELRACAVHAVELVVAALRAQGHTANAMMIDNLLWSRGQGKQYKQARPRHRTRSVFY